MLQECPYRLVTLDDGGRIFAGQASDEFVNEVLYLRPGAGGLHLIAPAPQPVARCPAHVCLRIPKLGVASLQEALDPLGGCLGFGVEATH